METDWVLTCIAFRIALNCVCVYVSHTLFQSASNSSSAFEVFSVEMFVFSGGGGVGRVSIFILISSFNCFNLE